MTDTVQRKREQHVPEEILDHQRMFRQLGGLQELRPGAPQWHRSPPVRSVHIRPATPALVDHRGALGNQELPGPVHRQHGLLFDILHGDEPHVGPAHRFTDGIRIVAVMLVVVPIGGDELRRSLGIGL